MRRRAALTRAEAAVRRWRRPLILAFVGSAVVVLAMMLVHRGDDRVFAAHGFRMELGVLLAEMLLELGIEPETQRALGTLKGFHPPMFAPLGREC